MLKLIRDLLRMSPSERYNYFLNAYKRDADKAREHGARWLAKQLDKQIARMESYDNKVIGRFEDGINRARKT